MNSIAKLLILPAFQNEGTLEDYFDPWIAKWTDDFIETGLSDKTHKEIIDKGLDLEEAVKELPGIEEGLGRDLLIEWTDWIMGDQGRRKILKDYLTEYFIWKGELFWVGNDEVDWKIDPEMPNTPEEAWMWYQKAEL